MDGSVPILFLMVVLKIPVGLLLYLVWWSIRAVPEVEEAPPGADDHEFRRWNRPKPRPPRAPPRPPRSRLAAAAGLPAGRPPRGRRLPAPVRAGAHSRGSAVRV